MSYRLSKIYTRTGDDGKTQVSANERISKCSYRIEALGTIDELNCTLGLMLSFMTNHSEIKNIIQQIQHELFDLGGELCPPHHLAITADKVFRLEKIIDDWNATLAPLKEFILPGGNTVTAHCHLARAVCRRAERTLVALHFEEPFNPEILRYINRLSDLLFVAGRVLADPNAEILWDHDRA